MRKLTGDHCVCRTCGEYFNSTAAFDMHRMGDYTERRCLSIAEMEAKGMALSSTQWWLTQKNDDSSLRRLRRSGDLPEAVAEEGV